MKETLLKKLISFILVCALLLGLAIPIYAAPADDIEKLYEQGRYIEANEIIEKNYDRYKNDVHFLYETAITYSALNRIDESIATCELIISITNGRGETALNAYFQMANNYSTKGEYSKALEYYELNKNNSIEQKLFNKKDEAYYYNNTASVYYKMGDLNTAIELVEKSVSSQNLSFNIQRQGYYNEILSNNAKALELYTKASNSSSDWDINKRQASAFTAKAKLQLRMGKYDEALQTIQQSAKKQPNQFEAYIQEARILYFAKNGDLNRALNQLITAEKYAIFPRDIAYIEVWRGLIFKSVGDTINSKNAFDKALTFIPINDFDYYKKAQIYALIGDADGVLTTLSYLYQRAPGYKYDVSIDMDFEGVRNLDSELKSSITSSWSQEDINRARNIGLIPPSLDSNYRQNITRAEFCELAVRLYEKITGKEIYNPYQDYKNPHQSPQFIFTDIYDISEDKRNAIYKMEYLGVVSSSPKSKSPTSFLFVRCSNVNV